MLASTIRCNPRIRLTDGSHMPNRTVLFVCVHNAGRSQMAAAFLRYHSASHITVLSAGSAPANTINPVVIEVLAERGLGLETEQPMLLDNEAVQAADVCITMGCGDVCTVYPGTTYLDWELDDPSDRDIVAVREIRDAIEKLVLTLLDDMTERHPGTPS